MEVFYTHSTQMCGTNYKMVMFPFLLRFKANTQQKYLHRIIICSFTTNQLHVNGLTCTLTSSKMVLDVIGMQVYVWVPQSVPTQSLIPNQCESNGHLGVQSVYKLVWQEWL